MRRAKEVKRKRRISISWIWGEEYKREKKEWLEERFLKKKKCPVGGIGGEGGLAPGCMFSFTW